MRGLLLFILVFSFVSSFSQPVIRFDKNVHDFGALKEIDGTVSYDFEFENTGSTPILIKNVESSCGCTSPQWTRQPILPGKKGFIKAVFDPKDRPGYFDKTISVQSNAKPAIVDLKIKGLVEGRTRTILDEFPYELPSGLRLPMEHVSLMKVTKGEKKKMAMEIYNNSGKQAAVSFSGLPPYLKMAIEPQQIPDKGQAVLKVEYNTALHGEYGLNREEVTINVSGKKYMLPVSVFIDEDFNGVDIAKAPVVDAEKKYHNFGEVTTTEIAGFTYQIRNTGKSPLKIHRVYTNDERVTARTDAKELQPDGTATLKVETVKGAAKGKVTCMVSVITNSPSIPELTLRFYGEIK